MKNKGFTLIELITVITLLGVIGLIAVPVIMDVIEDTKVESAKVSAENYIKAVDTAVGTSRMKGKELKGTYAVLEDGSLCEVGNTCDDDTKVTIKLTGNIPSTESVVEIKDGAVLSGTIIIEDYTLTYNSEKLKDKIEVKEESN